MEKAIPEASRAILKEWQAKGLKFKVIGMKPNFTLEFTSAGKETYSIPEQPIPENLTLKQLEIMYNQGLKLEAVNFMTPIRSVRNLFNVSRNDLRISAQPIPEKLLEVPVTELPVEECVIGTGEQALPEVLQTWRRDLPEAAPNGLDPHDPGAKLDAGKNPLTRQESGDHYVKQKIQPVEYIHANNIPFIEGCVIKRMTRWRDKPNGFDDLHKAIHEIELLIHLEKTKFVKEEQ